MVPDVAKAIRAKACVRTVYLVASDYHDKDREKYMLAREKGLRAAYAQAAGKPASAWVTRTTTINGHKLPLFTLGDNVSIVEFRLPDNGRVGAAGMLRLYAKGASIADFYRSNTYNRAGLTRTLTALLDRFRPDLVRTMDPSGWDHGGEDYTDSHKDHVVSARLTADAAASSSRTYELRYYRDYTNRYAAANLSRAAHRDKLSLFRTFAFYDEDICGPKKPRSSCVSASDPTTPFYYALTFNQYRATPAAMLPYVPAEKGRPGHLVRARFRHRRIRYGHSPLCLSARDALTDRDREDIGRAELGSCKRIEPIPPDTADRTPYFTMVGSYLKLDKANQCLGTLRGGRKVNTPIVVKMCTGTPTQRWRWDPGRHVFVNRAAGLVMAPYLGGSLEGTPLVLASR